MAFDLTDAITEVRGRLQDQASTNPHLTDADITIAVRAAIQRYSTDRPRHLVAEFAGDGGQYYALTTVLASWQEDYSSIESVEYPAAAIATDEEPSVLDPALDYEIALALSGSTRTLYLYLPNHTPAATENVRVVYTALHTLNLLDSATATSISSAHQAAFYNLAAGFALEQLAALMSQKGDSTIAADVTSHPTLAEQLSSRSKFWFKEYYRAVGLNDKGQGGVGASGWLEWDVMSGERYDLLFHGRRSR